MLLGIQTLAQTQRKDDVLNVNRESHRVTLTKEDERAKRGKGMAKK